ncbi:hypothetical protein E2C01_008311 [Portunus trituberculatus]|uniref:Uncharacterized protein n=1 Tax=Portunus trituberculatus TaxID=210409 RepID=A0A5B7D212_PORTR|nr:hypothetical protein [Portunus trituberculatus]
MRSVSVIDLDLDTGKLHCGIWCDVITPLGWKFNSASNTLQVTYRCYRPGHMLLRRRRGRGLAKLAFAALVRWHHCPWCKKGYQMCSRKQVDKPTVIGSWVSQSEQSDEKGVCLSQPQPGSLSLISHQFFLWPLRSLDVPSCHCSVSYPPFTRRITPCGTTRLVLEVNAFLPRSRWFMVSGVPRCPLPPVPTIPALPRVELTRCWEAEE